MKEIIIGDTKINGLWSKGYTLPEGVYGRTRAGSLWKAINTRCRKYNSVNNFENFQHFCEYIQGLAFKMEFESNGKYWQIDKDLNLLGDRSYNEANIIFVPNEINSFITNMSLPRELPLGVTYIDRTSSGKFKGLTKPYRANCKDRVGYEEGTVYLHYYDNPTDAHIAWLTHKLKLLKEKIQQPKLKHHPRLQVFAEVWIETLTGCINNRTIFKR